MSSHEYFGQDRRAPDSQDELVQKVIAAVKEQQHLTDEEAQWVRLAIKREAQSIALRQAIIEKTLTALVWAALIGLGIVLKEFLFNHGAK
jgi:hypothetical protein